MQDAPVPEWSERVTDVAADAVASDVRPMQAGPRAAAESRDIGFDAAKEIARRREDSRRAAGRHRSTADEALEAAGPEFGRRLAAHVRDETGEALAALRAVLDAHRAAAVNGSGSTRG